MADESPASLAEAVDDSAVRGMVDALEPGGRVRSIERISHGTEFIAELDVDTPDGPLAAVLKATTADLVPPEIARAEPRLLELVGRETAIPIPTVYGYCDDHEAYPAPFTLLSYSTDKYTCDVIMLILYGYVGASVLFQVDRHNGY